MAELTQRQKTGIVAGVFAVTGLGIILVALNKGAGAATGVGTLTPLHPGESMGNLITDNLDGLSAGAIILPAGVPESSLLPQIMAANPRVMYAGPGRDCFTYLAVRQVQNGILQTVAASGLANVHVGPSGAPAGFRLIDPAQTEPAGCGAQSLCAYAWPGINVNPVCGAPPMVGPADLYLEIYQNSFDSGDGRDADGDSSPTCNKRNYVFQRKYPSLVMFV